MKMSKNKITVIIPIYEVTGAACKCVDSVLKQDYPDFEIICADMSGDAYELIHEYMDKNSNVAGIFKNKRGNEINLAVQQANGEYISFVEADDYVLPNMLTELYALTENGMTDVVKSNYFDLCTGADDTRLQDYICQDRNSTVCLAHSFKLEENPEILWGVSAIWASLYKKSYLEKEKIVLDAHFSKKCNDLQTHTFFVETLVKAEKIVWTDKAYYCHKNSKNPKYLPLDMIIENIEENKKCITMLEKKYSGNPLVEKVWYAKIIDFYKRVREKYNGIIPGKTERAFRSLFCLIKEDIICSYFNTFDQKLYYGVISPVESKKSRILIYNWLPYDNPWKWGGGVTVYCQNIMNELLEQNPNVEIYFLSSGFAYDATKVETYIRKVGFTAEDRIHQMEIVNSPVPAEQRWLYVNPLVALKNDSLKNVFSDYMETYGPFDAVHFNNIEGLSLDVLDLKVKFPQTKFIYSMHNYVPLCVNGSYYMRHKHCNCTPDHTGGDCFACTRADIRSNIAHETYMRGVWGDPQNLYSELYWIRQFGFARLDEDVSLERIKDFAKTAVQKINKNCDSILAVSKRVYEIAEDNGIDVSKMSVSYIGTKVADTQMGHPATEKCDGILKIVFLGNDLFYEEKGYPFLMEALSEMDVKYASKIDLLLTVKQKEHAQMYDMLKNFHSVQIVNGYTHDDFEWIFKDCHLSIVPVLWEDNLPQIAIESVAYGVPVLASSAGGASELTESPLFRYECGDKEELLQKIAHFVDHPSDLLKYWESHHGLVTLDMHIQELMEVYGFDRKRIQSEKITFTYEEFQTLLKEKKFLESNFQKGRVERIVERIENTEEIQKIKDEMQKIKDEKNKMEEHEKYLQYVIDETYNSKTYRIGRAITAIPRKIIGNKEQ